jgi:hypothetical protein
VILLIYAGMAGLLLVAGHRSAAVFRGSKSQPIQQPPAEHISLRQANGVVVS